MQESRILGRELYVSPSTWNLNVSDLERSPTEGNPESRFKSREIDRIKFLGHETGKNSKRD